MSNEQKKEETMIHFSVGSAATGTHLSTDVVLDDNAPETLQRVMDLWMQTTLYRKNTIDMRLKG